MKIRAKYGTIKPFAKLLGANANRLTLILNGDSGISKKRALDYEKKCKAAGYPFTANDWLFSPGKIKEQLSQK